MAKANGTTKATAVVTAAPTTPAGRATAAVLLRTLRTQWDAVTNPKLAASKKLQADMLAAEQAVYAHRVVRCARPAKVASGRQPSYAGLPLAAAAAGVVLGADEQ